MFECFAVLTNIGWAIENLVISLDRAHRVLLEQRDMSFGTDS